MLFIVVKKHLLITNFFEILRTFQQNCFDILQFIIDGNFVAELYLGCQKEQFGTGIPNAIFFVKEISY